MCERGRLTRLSVLKGAPVTDTCFSFQVNCRWQSYKEITIQSLSELVAPEKNQWSRIFIVTFETNCYVSELCQQQELPSITFIARASTEWKIPAKYRVIVADSVVADQLTKFLDWNKTCQKHYASHSLHEIFPGSRPVIFSLKLQWEKIERCCHKNRKHFQ